MFSELTIQQFRKFRSFKRAWYSLILLVTFYLLSLFSEHLANSRPLVAGFDGNLLFPTLNFHTDADLGGAFRTEADYKTLRDDPDFLAKGGWMIFPIIPHDPLASDWEEPGAPPHPPSQRHWLGTDNSSRDVMARILYAFRTGMTFALALTATSLVLGVLIGSLQGYAGGAVDITAQRFVEIWSALPFLYVVILMGSIYGQSFGILLLVFTLFRWIGMSYYVRAEFLRLKNQTYVQAAQAQGAGHALIILRHILPNAFTPILTLLPFSLVTAISALTALDFLGFGIAPPAPSWGELLQQGLENLYAPWMTLSAVAALFLTLLLASFVGEGARAAFDPRASSTR